MSTKGFSLIELLVVIAILGIITSTGFLFLQDSLRDSRIQNEFTHTLQLIKKYAKQSLTSQLRPICQQLNSYVNHASRLQIIHFLFGVSASDNEVHNSEVELIKRIALYLNINQYDFDSIKSMFLIQDGDENLDNWFKILEVKKNASVQEIKKAHRKMVMKYHPDKLQGVSEDIIKLAEEKFKLVQDAYEKIMQKRS